MVLKVGHLYVTNNDFFTQDGELIGRHDYEKLKYFMFLHNGSKNFNFTNLITVIYENAICITFSDNIMELTPNILYEKFQGTQY